MKEHPILFSAPMVRAILDGRKTQTRRVIKPQPSERFFVEGVARLTIGMNPAEDGRNWYDADGVNPGRLVRPPWRVGDKLWVRETWCHKADDNGMIVYNAEGDWDASCVWYAADGIDVRMVDGDGWGVTNKDGTERRPWRPSIHMPRWASRITLEVTRVWAERLQDISEADARAEGVEPYRCPQADALMNAVGGGMKPIPYTSGFANLWNSIAKPGEAWHANPWVWVREFKREVAR